MKHEWKKQEKNLYGAGKEPAVVDVPTQQFIRLSGKGNPNEPDFSDRVSALYSLAYAVKMGWKAEGKKNGASDLADYSVYPLEGIWRLAEGDRLIKEKLEYTIMIRQPDFITQDMVYRALEKVKMKKPGPLYDEIRFEPVCGGKYVEILHVGPFDEEPASFARLDRFAVENNLKRAESCHTEIYLNNCNRVEKSRLKTILRYRVEQLPA